MTPSQAAWLRKLRDEGPQGTFHLHGTDLTEIDALGRLWQPVGDFDLLDFAMENLATSPFRRIFGQWVMVCFGNRKTAPTGGKVA